MHIETTGNAPAIQRLSVADQVYDKLRARILSGELAQGSRVVEAQLAKELGTSRAPVREAVNRLVEAGLLESRTHYVNTVVQMTPAKVRQLYAVRVAVETLAVREALARGGIDLKLLKARIREIRTYAKAKDPAGLAAAELRFHAALWSMARNPFIDLVAGLLADQMLLALAVDNAAYGDLEDVAREHEPVVEALATGDPDHAASVLRDHILVSLEALAKAQGDDVAE